MYLRKTPDPCQAPVNISPPCDIFPAVVEEVVPGATLAAEGDHRLGPALAPLNRPGHGLALLVPAPAAAPAPTHDPGVQTHTSAHTTRNKK